MRILATATSWAPFVSVKVNMKVCVNPVLRPGLTPPTPGPETPDPGEPHVPSADQPELDAASCAARYITLFPANDGVKVIGRVSVRVLPLPDTRLPTA